MVNEVVEKLSVDASDSLEFDISDTDKEFLLSKGVDLDAVITSEEVGDSSKYMDKSIPLDRQSIIKKE